MKKYKPKVKHKNFLKLSTYNLNFYHKLLGVFIDYKHQQTMFQSRPFNWNNEVYLTSCASDNFTEFVFYTYTLRIQICSHSIGDQHLSQLDDVQNNWNHVHYLY